MTAPPETLRLGIIGGCLTHQPGIPLSALFHRQLADQFRARTNMRLQVRIAREFRRPYAERLDSLLASHEVDGVLLHMRVVIASKSTLLARRSSGAVAHYSLHPFLFKRRQVGWAEWIENGSGVHGVLRRRAISVGADEHRQRRPGHRVFGFRLGDLNLALGHLVGLDEWAIRDEMAMLSRFAQCCLERRLPFMVLGPSATGEVPQINRLGARLIGRVRALVSPLGVPICEINSTIDENGEPVLMPDGHHLNENGHRYVASRLLPIVTEWARRIMASHDAVPATDETTPSLKSDLLMGSGA